MITLQNSNIDNVGVQGMNSKKEFDLFFKKYYTLFLSFACRYNLDTEEARDIVQDVFIAFWEQHENFTSIVTIKAFFYRSIANRCLNYLKHEDVKSRYAESRLERMESEEFIQENIIREEVSFIVRKKIKQLTPREQEIIILSLQNKSNQEIADILSLSLPTVKTHKMHAYARLRAELEELRFLLLIL
ncbi:RNA polymerase sigma-70 factor [uncultured Bacteroides sp.]|uniref:RNA polymerase sigma-70 factor n=1 Tax=uncultured Bacteroides sp. TaxID=162156 RepID=UPI0025CDF50F|nr:RNA polymerase sigma-70 factor [uncultured Bacteroides sp.]